MLAFYYLIFAVVFDGLVVSNSVSVNQNITQTAVEDGGRPEVGLKKLLEPKSLSPSYATNFIFFSVKHSYKTQTHSSPSHCAKQHGCLPLSISLHRCTSLTPTASRKNREKMENKGAVIKLPPGFRFCPTDEELVVQYLKRKVLSYPLPAAPIMPDIQLSVYDPWDIPAGGAVGCGEKERYFFHFKKEANGNRVSRAAGSGYWKVTGKDKRVTVGEGKQVVGVKRVMAFHKGRPSNGSTRTDWVLHEYRLTQDNSPTTHMGGWVLCRVFQKERSINNKYSKMSKPSTNQDDTSKQNGFIEIMKQKYHHHVGSPDQEMESSCVTQDSGDDEEEEQSNFHAASEKNLKNFFR